MKKTAKQILQERLQNNEEIVENIASAFYNRLDAEEIEFCLAPTAYEERGFTALHDLFCANEELLQVAEFVYPEMSIDCSESDDFDLFNRITKRINEIIATKHATIIR